MIESSALECLIGFGIAIDIVDVSFFQGLLPPPKPPNHPKKRKTLNPGGMHSIFEKYASA